MLNPNLDRAALAKQFAVDERIRIENVLDADVAERIRDCCANHLHYDYLTNVDSKNVALTEEEMKNLDPQQLSELQQHIMAAAAEGVGFFYCGYQMGREPDDPGNEKIRFLHSVFNFLNSACFTVPIFVSSSSAISLSRHCSRCLSTKQTRSMSLRCLSALARSRSKSPAWWMSSCESASSGISTSSGSNDAGRCFRISCNAALTAMR